MTTVTGDMPEESPHSESAETAAQASGPERDRLREATATSWRAARNRLARVGTDVRIEARYTAHAAERYARQKPWRVAGAAAALALLAGYLIGFRHGSAQLRRS
jgi:ElaB/YqjD/DUF883 family membrane-anchored ribosome-binding protein